MNNRGISFHAFSKADMKAFESDMKVGILATINEEGFPHLTLISTLQAGTPTEVIWGQFTEGLSKQFIKMNPRTAFLILTPEKELWRGKANFTRLLKIYPCHLPLPQPLFCFLLKLYQLVYFVVELIRVLQLLSGIRGHSTLHF